MNENINNNQENQETPVFEAPSNYLDYIVEEDVADVKTKKFSVTKLLGSIFGVISALAMIYCCVEIFISLGQQLSQYKQMGVQIPALSIVNAYLPYIIIVVFTLCTLVAAFLPVKYAKASILLSAMPVSYLLINSIPQVIMCIANKIPFGESYSVYLMLISGILTLASAILYSFSGREILCLLDEDDMDIEYYEYDDEEPEFFTDEEIEETVEETTDEE